MRYARRARLSSPAGPRQPAWYRRPPTISVLVAALCASCKAQDSTTAMRVSFDDAFREVSRFELEELPDDVIGEVGEFIETSDGSVVIADALQPRLRLYTPDGLLAADFGAFGAGPFEFRGIGGLAQDGEGRLIVTDPRLGRITILGEDLSPDTAVILRPAPRGPVVGMGSGLLFLTSDGSRASTLSFFPFGTWSRQWQVPAPSPGSMMEYPYWGSISRVPFTAFQGGFVVAYSLTYPIYVYDAAGTLVDSLSQGPPSFRRAEVVEAGTFAGPGASERLEDWLAGFDVIADLSVVADTLLIVTHGHLDRTATSRFSQIHDRLDVYDLKGKRKLFEDLGLPPGGRTLGGGTHLFLLVDQPPAPWSVIRVALRD